MNTSGETAVLSFGPVAQEEEQDYALPQVNSNGQAYAPKWLFKKCGARFGFGGKLVTFNSNCLTVRTQVISDSEQSMSKLVTDFDRELQQTMQMSDLPTLLERKARQGANANEKLEYLAIKCLASGDSTDILKEFGIESKKINFEAERFLGKQITKSAEPTAQQKKAQPLVTANPFASDLGSMSAEAATDFFANLGSMEAKQPPKSKPEAAKEAQPESVSTEELQMVAEQVSRN